MSTKIKTLCIFRTLLEDETISALSDYLDNPNVSGYSKFVSLLYDANGGNLSEHLKTLCENDSNIYVRTAGCGSKPPKYMHSSLLSELQILQEVSELSKDDLCACLDYNEFLPDFTSTSLDLKEFYLHRIENIYKFGYGIFTKTNMFCVDENNDIVPVLNHDNTTLSQLIDYQRERQMVLDNTKALLSGKPAANMLLSGDAGTGKSSTIKAVTNELWRDGLRLIEIRKDQLRAIPKILNELSKNPLKFILFIDDLSFVKNDDNFSALKAVLEGSVTAKSSNVVIYATSNRRHMIKESFSDREGDDLHINDTLQELTSLSERFGIHVRFSKPNKDVFLNIVHYLAEQKGIDMSSDKLDMLAERFALERGGRSARLANQFIDSLLSKQDL